MWTKCGQIDFFGVFLRGQNPRKANTHRYLPQHCLYFFPEPQKLCTPILSVLFVFIILPVFQAFPD